VRVFDVEYSTRNRRTASNGSLGFRGGQTVDGVRHLSQGDTNARVYRSHADRVKRIVTESSPYLFLTCSEDGEVRQWDLRQPSAAYPEPREGRMLFSNRRHRSDSESHGMVPPPLISYRRYRLDLNTISCSASQPHYIALGGAHLHCFLHDRRMIGRDTALERGSESPFSIDTDFRGDEMGKATRCVRRFAPNGTKKMDRLSNGHITACKISDANPNEMIVSWSGENIYSFDLVHSPDANDRASSKGTMQSSSSHKARGSMERKRKRPGASPPPDETASKQRRSRSLSSENNEDVALRVRYGNGQSEDIALEATVPGATVEAARQSVLTPSQRRSLRIAKSVVKIRRLLFSLDHDTSSSVNEQTSPQQHVESFQKAALLATKTLEHMDRVITAWRYPVDPDADEVAVQTALRRNRDRARRFVQAAGTLAQHWAEWSGEWESAPKLNEIGSPVTEGPVHDNSEIFRYDFLKAILAWLKGGTDALLSAFCERSRPIRQAFRFPIPKAAGYSAINRYLIRHLLLLACERSVPDLDRNRFEHDATRQLFETERHAVTAFEHIIEVATEANRESAGTAESSGSAQKELAEKARLYDAETTRKFWGFKVARGLLMNAAEGVDFSLVDRAYGGIGREHRVDGGRDQTDINPNEEDPQIESAVLVRRPASESVANAEHSQADTESVTVLDDDIPDSDEEAMVLLSQLQERILENDSTADEEDEDEDDGDIDVYDSSDNEGHGEHDSDDDSDDDEGGALPFSRRRLLFSNATERMLLRESVDADVPVSSHTRTYTGHCNVKTVKDVNFYGLNDEYIVSGSDSGHVFIWDRKTTKLLNILVGDGDIVNVVQGKLHLFPQRTF
jgi:DDB1- and CUL4-associated factor 6